MLWGWEGVGEGVVHVYYTNTAAVMLASYNVDHKLL